MIDGTYIIAAKAALLNNQNHENAFKFFFKFAMKKYFEKKIV